MVNAAQPNTLERKIYFNRAYIGDDENGEPLNFDPSPALNVISALPFTNDDTGRYDFDADGNAVCLMSYSPGQVKNLQFSRIRRTGLPQLEEAGRITDLNVPPDAGLLETAHIVFFSNNIVGIEYNHFGPRISRLGSYIAQKSNGTLPVIQFRPIFRSDVAGQLDRLEEIRELDISVYPVYVDRVAQADRSLGQAFNAAYEAVEDTDTVRLVLKLGETSRQSWMQRVIPAFRILVGQDEFPLYVQRAQMRGRCSDSGRVETIDLLKDQVISTKRIVRLNPRGRALNPTSAFDSIIEAYQDLRDDLLQTTVTSQ